MVKKILLIIVAFSSCGTTKTNSNWILLDQEKANDLAVAYPNEVEILNSYENISMLETSSEMIGEISEFVHETYSQCGGFFAFESLEKAESVFLTQPKPLKNEVNYTIKNEEYVRYLIAQIDENKLKEEIITLTKYPDRSMKSVYGVESQKWIFSKWSSLSTGNLEVKLIQHDFLQPSVMATIKGSEDLNDYIVIGAHGDSKNFEIGGGNAPGADDNASGIAVMSEIIRILQKEQFKPKKNIVFIAYAGEEEGLRGSLAIAEQFAQENRNVLGVLNLDMVSVAFMGNKIRISKNDFSNNKLDDYFIRLLNVYTPEFESFPYRCGYACSDHAAWTMNGFPATFVHGGNNQKIHTKNDFYEFIDTTHKVIKAVTSISLGFTIELTK